MTLLMMMDGTWRCANHVLLAAEPLVVA